MSIRRSRAAHHEEYREFFSILASGDRDLYARAQATLAVKKAPTSPPPRLQLRPVQVTIETLADALEHDSDKDSVKVTEVHPDKEGDVKTVEIAVLEVQSGDSDTSSISEVDDFRDTSSAPQPTPPHPILSMPPLAAESAVRSTQPTSLLPADITSESPIIEYAPSIVSSGSVTATKDEFRFTFKKMLHTLYDLDTFRGLVRDVLRESQKTFRPLKEVEARRAWSVVASAVDEEPKGADPGLVFTDLGLGLSEGKEGHATKKRCLAKASGDEDEEPMLLSEPAAVGNAQLVMDMLADLMAPSPKGSLKRGLKKMRSSLNVKAMTWPKPKSAKKRTYTDRDA